MAFTRRGSFERYTATPDPTFDQTHPVESEKTEDILADFDFLDKELQDEAAQTNSPSVSQAPSQRQSATSATGLNPINDALDLQSPADAISKQLESLIAAHAHGSVTSLENSDDKSMKSVVLSSAHNITDGASADPGDYQSLRSMSLASLTSSVRSTDSLMPDLSRSGRTIYISSYTWVAPDEIESSWEELTVSIMEDELGSESVKMFHLFGRLFNVCRI